MRWQKVSPKISYHKLRPSTAVGTAVVVGVLGTGSLTGMDPMPKNGGPRRADQPELLGLIDLRAASIGQAFNQYQQALATRREAGGR